MEIVNWTDDSLVLEILKVSKYKKWLRKVINRFRGKQDIDLLMKRGMKVGKCFWCGDNCVFDNTYCWLIEIGDHVTFSNQVQVTTHDSSLYDFVQRTRLGKVIVEDYAFIGERALLLPGIKVGKGAIVAAGIVYFITVVIGFAICMVGVIFGSRLVFQRTCERRTTPWSDLGTADDDEYRILIDAYKIKNQSNETVMIQAFDNTKLIGHYYEREKGAPLIVFFHGLWGHSYLDGVPIYRITQKHNWNLLLCDLRAQGDSEGEFSTLGVLEKYDCLDWVEWAQNRFGDKNPIFLMGVSMGASIVMMSSDLELPDSVYGIIDDCGFTSTLDVIKQNNNKKISKYIPKNLLPTMLKVGTKIWGSFDLSDADACKALAHTDIPLLIIHGDEDMKAPLSMAYKLYDSCNGEKQLYIVHGADHSENYRKDPGGYEKIVTKFIEERLRQKKCQTPGTKL